MGDLVGKLSEKATSFKTRMEMFRVQLALGEAEAKDKAEEMQKELEKS